MVDAAPRIDSRLIAVIAQVDRPELPIAEAHRRVGRVAEHLGLTRPSYEQVRVVVHLLRASKMDPSAGKILLEVALRARPLAALTDLVD